MSNDLISRSALKDRAKTMLKIIGEDNLSDYEQGKKYAFETAIDFIDNAPTVDCIEFNRAKKLIKQAYQKGKDIRPQIEYIRRGEWIEHGKNYDLHSHRMFVSCECSACHMYEDFPEDDETGNILTSHYCKWCGSNMWKEDNE